jgi:hypothetical protein
MTGAVDCVVAPIRTTRPLRLVRATVSRDSYCGYGHVFRADFFHPTGDVYAAAIVDPLKAVRQLLFWQEVFAAVEQHIQKRLIKSDRLLQHESPSRT